MSLVLASNLFGKRAVGLRLKGPLVPLCEHCRNSLLRLLSWCSMKHLKCFRRVMIRQFVSGCTREMFTDTLDGYCALLYFIMWNMKITPRDFCFCDITIVTKTSDITRNCSLRQFNCQPCTWIKKVQLPYWPLRDQHVSRQR